MVDAQLPVVKLSDFGMSRDVYMDEYYKLQLATVMLPVCEFYRKCFW